MIDGVIYVSHFVGVNIVGKYSPVISLRII